MANYNVTYDRDSGSWRAKQAGASRTVGDFDTQAEAAAAAKQRAINSGGGDVSIHRRDNNQIREKNTYGKSDPFPPKG